MKKNYLLIGGAVAVLGTFLLVNSRRTIPKGAEPVQPFDLDNYLGTWYEIARLDSYFEKNLTNTTAHYSLKKDGDVRVSNRGYNTKTGKIEEAVGTAKFEGTPDVGQLKVSFGGPFYSPYNVLAVDEGYNYALVAGRNLSYLWLLSREIDMPETIRQEYIAKAKDLGFDTDQLVWVEHRYQ